MADIELDKYKRALVKKKQFLMFLCIGIAGMILDNAVLYSLTSFTNKKYYFPKL
jgi:putative flippase GtrA